MKASENFTNPNSTSTTNPIKEKSPPILSNQKINLHKVDDNDAKLKYVVEKIKSKIGKKLSMQPPPPSPIILLSNAASNTTPVKLTSPHAENSSFNQLHQKQQLQQQIREDNFLFDTLDDTNHDMSMSNKIVINSNTNMIVNDANANMNNINGASKVAKKLHSNAKSNSYKRKIFFTKLLFVWRIDLSVN